MAWDCPDIDQIVWSPREKRNAEERAKAFLLYCDLQKVTRPHKMIAYATIYNGCRLADLDANAVFETVAMRSEKKVAASLRRFLRRPEKRKSMAAFRLQVVDTSEGSRIVRME